MKASWVQAQVAGMLERKAEEERMRRLREKQTPNTASGFDRQRKRVYAKDGSFQYVFSGKEAV